MKKRQLLCFATILFILIFSACKKDMNDPSLSQVTNEDASDLVTPACAIDLIKGTNPDGITKAAFIYDGLGNPKKIKVDNVTTGNPNRLFRYNAQHRLTDYIGAYDNGTFEFWHKYGYNAAGKIVKDTVYIFGLLGATPTDYYERRISRLTYDAQGRVATENGLAYNYDSDGNLNNGLIYDHKKNLHRTNPIWQFIDRDYSVNNPIPTISYQSGFPRKISWSATGPDFPFLSFQFAGDITVKYTCP